MPRHLLKEVADDSAPPFLHLGDLKERKSIASSKPCPCFEATDLQGRQDGPSATETATEPRLQANLLLYKVGRHPNPSLHQSAQAPTAREAGSGQQRWLTLKERRERGEERPRERNSPCTWLRCECVADTDPLDMLVSECRPHRSILLRMKTRLFWACCMYV